MNHINQLIPNILFGKKGTCTYCGQEATTIDHVIPVSFYGVKRKYLTKDNGVRTYACRSCNSSLGGRVFTSFKDRLKHITEVNKRKSVKAKSKWSEEELAELDYTLSTYIRHKKNVSNTQSTKAKWVNSSGFNRAVANLKTMKELDPSESCYISWLADFFKGFV